MQIRSVYQSILIFAALVVLGGCHSYEGVIHRVESGEDVQSIAAKYQVSQEKLLQANPHLRIVAPKPGERMLIPQKISRVYVAKKKGGYTPLPPYEKPTEEDVEKEDKPTAELSPRAQINPKPIPTPPSSKTPPKPVLRMPERKESFKRNLDFVWPAKGKVVSTFGKKDEKMHNGIDIKTPTQADILASESGRVVFSGNELAGYGNLVIIRHQPKIYSIYAYLGSMLVKKGDDVKQGQPIAKSGKTDGTSFFHFEIRKAKQAFDPMKLLPSR